MLPLVSYVAYASVTDDDRQSQTPATVNGDGSKTAKIIKKAMLTTLTLTFRRC